MDRLNQGPDHRSVRGCVSRCRSYRRIALCSMFRRWEVAAASRTGIDGISASHRGKPAMNGGGSRYKVTSNRRMHIAPRKQAFQRPSEDAGKEGRRPHVKFVVDHHGDSAKFRSQSCRRGQALRFCAHSRRKVFEARIRAKNRRTGKHKIEAGRELSDDSLRAAAGKLGARDGLSVLDRRCAHDFRRGRGRCRLTGALPWARTLAGACRPRAGARPFREGS